MIRYEWTVELLEGDDIVDAFYGDTLSEALRQAGHTPAEFTQHSGVVRDRYDSAESLVCRSWAYVEDGKLPDRFTDACGREVAKVPARFHKEADKSVDRA
jgi:hypothetical protein